MNDIELVINEFVFGLQCELLTRYEDVNVVSNSDLVTGLTTINVKDGKHHFCVSVYTSVYQKIHVDVAYNPVGALSIFFNANDICDVTVSNLTYVITNPDKIKGVIDVVYKAIINDDPANQPEIPDFRKITGLK